MADVDNVFPFTVDDEAYNFCWEIVDVMTEKFGISQAEAIGRINRHWGNIGLGGPDEIAYHQIAEHWAGDIYYGHDSSWWIGTAPLKPLPYP